MTKLKLECDLVLPKDAVISEDGTSFTCGDRKYTLDDRLQFHAFIPEAEVVIYPHISKLHSISLIN